MGPSLSRTPSHSPMAYDADMTRRGDGADRPTVHRHLLSLVPACLPVALGDAEKAQGGSLKPVSLLALTSAGFMMLLLNVP